MAVFQRPFILTAQLSLLVSLLTCLLSCVQGTGGKTKRTREEDQAGQLKTLNDWLKCCRLWVRLSCMETSNYSWSTHFTYHKF